MGAVLRQYHPEFQGIVDKYWLSELLGISKESALAEFENINVENIAFIGGERIIHFIHSLKA